METTGKGAREGRSYVQEKGKSASAGVLKSGTRVG